MFLGNPIMYNALRKHNKLGYYKITLWTVEQ